MNRCPTLRATVHCRCYLDKETEMCRKTFDLPVCEVMASGHLTGISILVFVMELAFANPSLESHFPEDIDKY